MIQNVMLPSSLGIPLIHDSCQGGWEWTDSHGVGPARAYVVLTLRDGGQKAGRGREVWRVAYARNSDLCGVRMKSSDGDLEAGVSIQRWWWVLRAVTYRTVSSEFLRTLLHMGKQRRRVYCASGQSCCVSEQRRRIGGRNRGR